MSWIILDLLRKNPEELKEHIRKRFLDPSLVDKAYQIDLEWRKKLREVEQLRHKHNEISEKVGRTKDPVERDRLINEAREMLNMIMEKEKELKYLEDEREKILLQLPNIVHESVPIGDESANKPIKTWGVAKVYKEDLQQFFAETREKGVEMRYEEIDWKPIGHADMLEYVLKLGNTEKAAEVAGSRFYYLFEDLVWLDMALLWFAIDKMTQKGYILVLPPYMLREKIIEAVTDYATIKDAIYKIEGEDLVLIGTAEHSIAALHANEEIDEDRLPLKYVGISPCFRKEAGAGNRDLKGIFRVHQFHKVEQFIFSLPEQSWELHEEITRNAEELFQELGLPYRVVNIASGDLGAPAAKKYDIEVWMPAQAKFREMVSSSNVLDWQSYRLKIRFVRKRGRVKGYVHTLNSTAIASTRTITAILENYQDREGVVEIPKVLRKYLEPFQKAPKDYIHPAKKI